MYYRIGDEILYKYYIKFKPLNQRLFFLGNNDKTLIAILEFAEICIENQNVPEARKLLDEAETILEQVYVHPISFGLI